jgi:hypothetical protein
MRHTQTYTYAFYKYAFIRVAFVKIVVNGIVAAPGLQKEANIVINQKPFWTTFAEALAATKRYLSILGVQKSNRSKLKK